MAISERFVYESRHARSEREERFSFALRGACRQMKMPKIDDKLQLQADFGETDAICVEVFKNPATEEGVLLKVMARGPFEIGQQVWIVDSDGSKIGATVDNVLEQTIDSEVTLSTVLPA
jgi:hypothetical protein